MSVYTKVRNYSSKELLDRVAKLPSFKGYPTGYWILGVQSQEDLYDHFDDKFYVFKGDKFVTVTTGTTNAGATGLNFFQNYNPLGVLVVKTDEWYHGLWQYGLHKGKMPALRQVRPIKYYRDSNRDKKVDETGKIYEGLQGINFHTVTYTQNMSLVQKLIGGWSVGCQVLNNVGKYYEILSKLKTQDAITYCLIKEF